MRYCCPGALPFLAYAVLRGGGPDTRDDLRLRLCLPATEDGLGDSRCSCRWCSCWGFVHPVVPVVHVETVATMLILSGVAGV